VHLSPLLSCLRLLVKDAVNCLREGTLEVEGEVLDAATELEFKLNFSREGENWEAAVKGDGSLVVAVDCTQDDATVTAGRSRELMNGIQQLRKAAGLDLRDVVEVFFEEEDGVTIVEEAVAKNVASFESKFKGSIPLPFRLAPSWSVPLKSDLVDVGGSKVRVLICRPALAAKDTVDEKALKVLSTLEPGDFCPGQEFTFSVDGASRTLREGSDFFLSSASMARNASSLEWPA
jgi:isoleucyl-tRNA synthetase